MAKGFRVCLGVYGHISFGQKVLRGLCGGLGGYRIGV